MVPTDAELLVVLRNGDADESMRALLRAYGGGVYGFALKRLGDAGLAEEIVQDVMVKVWRNGAGFNHHRGSVRSWVYEIATNLVIDAHRRRAARPLLARHVGADGGESDSLELEILRWQVQEVLAQLRPEHREVISLIYFEGLKAREAAERVRVPVGTIKSRCYYALQSLRVALEEQELSP